MAQELAHLLQCHSVPYLQVAVAAAVAIAAAVRTKYNHSPSDKYRTINGRQNRWVAVADPPIYITLASA